MASADDGRTLAVIQGELWSARARDWAEFQEPQHRPKYEDGIRRTGIGPGRSVLDLGCGAGVFCRLAADAGASVTGIDAAPALVEIARERVPEGRFDVGDIQALPYQDRSFDIVTAFNILQFVPGPLTTLTEVRRVARPQGRIYILVWGREQHTELLAVMKALHPLVPPRPAGTSGPFALSAPGILEKLAGRSGWTAIETGYIELLYDYPDQATMLRAQCSSAPAVLAARASGEATVEHAITSALAHYRTTTGGYRLKAEYRYLTAAAQTADVSAPP
jgi:2-polyprenyl-3-methyl-5-hydroxy-6-metoxy-1,4-benzoquinol methylase